jgi:hypothetical protein
MVSIDYLVVARADGLGSLCVVTDRSLMSDEKAVTDPERIAAHVRSAGRQYGFDDARDPK